MKPIDHLIRQANRIGDFFDAMPERTEGLEGIANHIHKFWEPRMRQALLDFLDAHPSGQGTHAALSDIVLEAVTRNRDRLIPRSRHLLIPG